VVAVDDPFSAAQQAGLTVTGSSNSDSSAA
jgi:hypothetical protein